MLSQDYFKLCESLRAPENTIEEVLQMSETSSRKHRRPLKTALVAAAVAAVMIVGTAAAAPQAGPLIGSILGTCQFHAETGRRTVTLTDENGNTIFNDAGAPAESEVIILHAPSAARVVQRSGRDMLMLDGPDGLEEFDITSELAEHGAYHYAGRGFTVDVTGIPGSWQAHVIVDVPAD